MMNSHAATHSTTLSPALSGFHISVAVCILTLAGLLSVFVSPLMVLVPFVGAAALWLVLEFPMTLLGLVLAFMPFDFMAIALGKFFGLPHMTLVSVFDKEVLLLSVALLLWRRNGFKASTPDWFILGCFVLALIRTLLGGSLANFAEELGFILPYVVGRVAVLTAQQEQLWARCAVWIAGVLSIAGLAEVFIFGETPRTLLYLALGEEELPVSFHAMGFTGMRESATMIGPNAFGVLCMIALVLWWVYCRNPLPAALIAVGLVCSLTRAAWLGTAVAIPLLAALMRQRRRFVLYTAFALALFVMSIPVLGLGDYLFATKTGQDSSADWHKDTISDGLKFAATHPFGAGNNKVGPKALKEDRNALVFETTYPALASEYGIAPAVCLLGFLFSALYLVWKDKSPLSYAAVGILVSMFFVTIVTLPLGDRRLASWAMFPVGLAVRSAIIGELR